jgi:multidrug resistance efflux pump
MSRRNRIAVAAGAACVAVVAIVWFLLRGHGAATPVDAPSAAPSVPTTAVTFGTFVERVAGRGKVGPPAGSVAKLAFATAGILARVDVGVAEAVSAGQPLAELAGADVARRQLDAAVAKVAAMRSRFAAMQHGSGSALSDRIAAQSAVRASEAKVTLDEQTLARQRELFAGGVAAQKDVDAAAEQLALDRGDLRANEAKVTASSAGVGDALTQARSDYESAVSDAAVARRALENTVLRAPAAGVVVAIFKHVGEAVDSSTPAIALGPPATNVVTLTVAGSDGRRIKRGDAVDLVDTAVAVHGNGRVTGVVPSQDPVTQETTVVVAGIPPGALSGDAVDATVVVGQRRGLLVPASAVVTDPQSGRTLVFVREHDKDGKVTFAPRGITVIANDSRTALVAGEVRGGESVAAQGAFDLLAPSAGG